jgi:hypothetical protein
MEGMRRPRIRSLVPLAFVMIVLASSPPAAVAGSRMGDAASAAGTESTAAGWLALAIAIIALVLAVGFVMITSARGPHRPGHRGGHPRAT